MAYQLNPEQKARKSAYMKQYRQERKEYIRAYKKEYDDAHRGEISEYNKSYRKKHIGSDRQRFKIRYRILKEEEKMKKELEEKQKEPFIIMKGGI